MLIISFKIIIARLTDIGICSLQEVLLLGFTGPILRSFGFNWDIRFDCSIYFILVFRCIFGVTSDCYDRLFCRIFESAESMRLCVVGILIFTGLFNIEDISKYSTNIKGYCSHQWNCCYLILLL